MSRSRPTNRRRITAAPQPATAPAGTELATTRRTKVIVLKRDVVKGVIDRIAAPHVTLAALPNGSDEERVNAAIGCKTSEVALDILAQVVRIQHPDPSASSTATEEQVDEWLAEATALLSELQPTTAMESMLAAQMIGTQRLALEFMHRAALDGQTDDGVDRNVLRASRMMRMFNEQAETMSKSRGTSGQQRVVVEHVTVAAGGQAIVGVANGLTRGEGRGGV